MTTLNEKKWFVYLGDHHEGPFSVPEVQGLMSQGKVRRESYVWCGGMTDWRPMNEVLELSALLQAAVVAPPPPPPLSAQATSAMEFGDSIRKKPDESDFDEPTASLTGLSPAADPEAPAELLALAPESVEVTRTQPIDSEAAQDSPADAPSLASPSLAVEAASISLAPVQATARSPEKVTMDIASTDDEPSKSNSVSGLFSRIFGKKKKTEQPDHVPSNLVYSRYSGPIRGSDYSYASDRSARRFPKKLVTVVLLVGLYFAVKQGLLDPILSNPSIQGMLETATRISMPFVDLAREQAGKIPVLQQYLSPVAKYKDIDPADRIEIEKAMRTPLERGGPQVMVSLSKDDPTFPSFYVASNLPDGTSFDIYLKGVENTLLNHFQYTTRARVTVNGKLGKSAPIRATDGKAIPKGRYEVYVFDSKQQPQATAQVLGPLRPSGIKIAELAESAEFKPKIVKMKILFLGGPEDPTYISRLESFHARVREMSKKELSELDQFAKTLNGQFESTVSKFAQLTRRTRGPSTAKDWGAFHAKWEQFDRHLNDQFKRWTPEMLQSELYHGRLYTETKETGLALSELHSAQTRYLAMKKPDPAQQAMLAKMTEQAKLKMGALLSQLRQAQDAARATAGSSVKGGKPALAPGLPQGMPKRN